MSTFYFFHSLIIRWFLQVLHISETAPGQFLYVRVGLGNKFGRPTSAGQLHSLFVIRGRPYAYNFENPATCHVQLRQVKCKLDSEEIQVPHASTLSRSRLMLDLLIMNWRKQEFQNASSGFFTYLSSDSSPQAGTDFLLTLEDRVERRHAGLVVDATEEELAAWSASNYLQTSSLPVAVVGAGNSGVAGKYEGLLHSIVCDCGNEASPDAFACLYFSHV